MSHVLAHASFMYGVPNLAMSFLQIGKTLMQLPKLIFLWVDSEGLPISENKCIVFAR